MANYRFSSQVPWDASQFAFFLRFETVAKAVAGVVWNGLASKGSGDELVEYNRVTTAPCTCLS